MTSNLSAIDFIQERSEATPGLFNRFLSTISANIAAIDSNATINLSGATLSIGSSVSIGRDLWVQGTVTVGTEPSVATRTAVNIGVRSDTSDYLYFTDASGLRSSYIIGSHVGGTADGLNIWDQSGSTMIVSFSKQSVRFYQNVVGPVFDVGGALANTLNAGTFGTGADSKESRIQAAISAATASNISRVYVPANMYPYSAASISFSTSVRMVREGGNWSVFDVQAYGANGLNVTSDSSAFLAALSAASIVAGIVYVPSPVSGYRMTTTLIVWPNVTMIGENKHGTRIVKSHGTNMLEYHFGASMDHLWLDGNGSNFSGTGVRIFAGHGKQTTRSCQITNFSDYCIEFVTETAGSQSYWEDMELYQSEGTRPGQEAVSIRGSLTAAANPRTFIGIQTEGKRFASFGPCNNVQVVASRIGDCIWDANSRGVVIASCRIAGFAPPSNMTVLGANHAIVGCHIAPRMVAGAGLASSVFRGNSYDNPIIIDQAFDGSNVLEDQKSTFSFPFVLFSASSTIPDVSQGNFFQANNASATTITNFANGYNGQAFALRMDVNTGIQHNSSNIRLTEGQDIQAGTISPDNIIEFVRISGIWFEKSRSWTIPVTKAFVGNALLPEWAVNSETSLGWYRSGVSRIALTYGQFQLPTGSSTTPAIGFTSETSLGFYRSAASNLALSYGTLNIISGRLKVNNAQTLTFGDSANANGVLLGTPNANSDFFINQVNSNNIDLMTSGTTRIRIDSGGSVNLLQNRLLSMRTLAASSLTPSAANTNVRANECVFTVGGASGASFAIHSGGTVYIFDSTSSAKAT